MTHAREPFDRLPERVGPYRRLRQLGAGGMGAVFEVEHEETGARYALKVILPEALGVEGLARFRQEAEAMARLDHRHLAKIHTARLEPPLFFLVLDLYPGGTLEARLADGPLPVAEATSIAARVADGVAHAHAHGVLHRDIKPENVLFDDRGQPMLADFGLSRGDSAERMTQTGDLLGSPTTMAPEQVTDAKAVGPPADVYGLGALLYRMLTGEPPIPPAATVVGTLARVLEHAPRAPHELRPEVSPALSALCLRALSKQPELRPSARELGDALAGRSVAPGQARHAGRLAGAALLAALAVSGVAVVWVGSRGGASEPPRGPAPEAPGEVARAQLPRWVESLDGRHVALTVSADGQALSLLADCSLRPGEGGTHTLTLRPARLRTWDGVAGRAFVPSERASDDESLGPACAQLLAVPVTVRFGADGACAQVECPLAGPAQNPTRPLETLAASSFDGELLLDFFRELGRRVRRQAPGPLQYELAVAPDGAFVGAVVTRPGGWLALEAVEVARFEDGALNLEEGKARVRASNGGQAQELSEATLRVTNGLSDGAELRGLLELPAPEVARRLRQVRPPYEVLGPATDQDPVVVYARPWGAPLGRLNPSLGYLSLGERVGSWKAIGWKGGEAWCRGRLVPATAPGWVGVVSTARGQALTVYAASRPRERIGSLAHGQVVPVRDPTRPRPIEGLGGACVPEWGSWVDVAWGDRSARVRASELSPDANYVLNLLLAPTATELDAPFTQGDVPFAPKR